MEARPQHRGAARLLGIPLEEYVGHVGQGEKWCSGCKAWHHLAAFGRNRTTATGIADRCKEADAARKRESRDSPVRRRSSNEHVALLHDVYEMAAAKRSYAEIMDAIREAVGRP
jgi:hypothetical protein